MMEFKKKSKTSKLNDKGSAIVMVIVVVAFITILATTLLYVAGANYYRKATDLKNKESFYEAETVLEEIRAALALEVSEAAEKAYVTVSINYAVADSKTRDSLFQNEFFEVLGGNWTNKTLDDTGNPIELVDVVRALVTEEAGKNKRKSIISVNKWEMHADEGYAILEGVVLEYTDAQGYTTKITTDYVINIPTVRWDIDQSMISGEEASDEDLQRGTVDMADYVTYHNYRKQ